MYLLSTGRSAYVRIVSVLDHRTRAALVPVVMLLLAMMCPSTPMAIAADDPVALAPPSFSVKRGFYSSPFQLALSAPSGAAIRSHRAHRREVRAIVSRRQRD
jgi:hypothetical protein